MAESAGKKGAKGLVYAMVLALVAGIAATIYVHSEYSALANTRLTDGKKAADVLRYLAPSVENYFDNVAAGNITSVSAERIQRTQEAVTELLRDPVKGVGISPENYRISQTENRATRRETHDEFKLTIALEKVTRAQYERLIQLLLRDFSDYATIRSIDIRPEGRVGDDDFAGNTSPSQHFKADLELTWFVASATAGTQP